MIATRSTPVSVLDRSCADMLKESCMSGGNDLSTSIDFSNSATVRRWTIPVSFRQRNEYARSNAPQLRASPPG
jgi:hypothetical protein